MGSHIVDRLIEADHDVTVVDSLISQPNGAPPAYLNPDARYVWCDLSDDRQVLDALMGAEAVSHQASKVGLGTSFSDVKRYVTDNDVGTAHLLATLFALGFEGRFVLASSMVVYGEGNYSCLTHGRTAPPPRSESDLRAGRFEPMCLECSIDLVPDSVLENARSDPRNVYAATKLHQEHLCAASRAKRKRS